MKGYLAFPNAPALLEPHHQIIWFHILDTHWGGESNPLNRETVVVFYSSSRLGKEKFEEKYIEKLIHKEPDNDSIEYFSETLV